MSRFSGAVLSPVSICRILTKKIGLSFLFAIWLCSCGSESTNKLTIEYKKSFDSIPSASGIAVRGNDVFVVCDDGTGIYRINLPDYHQTKLPVKGLPSELYREHKTVKHDFESACFVKWKEKDYLMAMGSGSTAGFRDSLLLMNTADFTDQRIISLHTFYNQLQSITHTDRSQLNIEGLTVVGNNLIIVNRGNNLMISCNLSDFLSWLTESADTVPQIKYHKLALPSIDKKEARLSGICTIDDTHLLFCASVEDTPDWTKDGPVLGSFFGIYSIKDEKISATYLLKDENDLPLKEKIESVDILQNKDGDLIFLAAGDNDDGTSDLFRLKLRFN